MQALHSLHFQNNTAFTYANILRHSIYQLISLQQLQVLLIKSRIIHPITNEKLHFGSAILYGNPPLTLVINSNTMTLGKQTAIIVIQLSNFPSPPKTPFHLFCFHSGNGGVQEIPASKLHRVSCFSSPDLLLLSVIISDAN